MRVLFHLLKKEKECGKMNIASGHGAAVARAVRDREVAGSNPVAPTRYSNHAGFMTYQQAKKRVVAK